MKFHKPRLRVTQLTMGFRCEMQLYLLKNVGPMPPSGSMTTGSAVHKASSVNFEEKATSGIDAPLDVCTDAFNDYFKEWMLDTEWTTYKPEDMHKKGVRMVTSIHDNMFPPINIESPEDVEKNYILDCGDFEISGTVDLKLPGNEGLKDLKTGRNMWNTAKADKEIQGFLYPHISDPYGDDMLMPLEFMVVTHAGKIGNFRVQHPRSAAEYIIRQARGLLKMIDGYGEPKVNTGHFLCNDNNCGWKRHGFCPLFPK